MIDNEKCKIKVKNVGFKITDDQICTFNKIGEGTCVVSLASDVPKIVTKKNDLNSKLFMNRVILEGHLQLVITSLESYLTGSHVQSEYLIFLPESPYTQIGLKKSWLIMDL